MEASRDSDSARGRGERDAERDQPGADLLRVACRDTAELDAFLRTLRNRFGAADTETTIVLRSGPP